jgi:asparagine synthase (glutamine-hydrolysing)
MCGIFGVVSKEKIELNRSKKLLSLINHRGPDSQSIEVIKDTIHLGHVRLSILDLSKAGQQPMWSRCGNYCIVYNGEVYNFKELAKKYKLLNLRSNSDTEVILELLAEKGSDIIKELNGMFAFALYNKTTQKIVIARDRLGIKPLYFTSSEKGMSFASEIKALNFKSDTINEKVLHEWSYYGVALGEHTLYSNVNKLLPGHILEIDTKSLEIKSSCFWEISPPTLKSTTTNFDQLVIKNRELLEQAVRRQLVSDVPVGVFLSGGIDSSAITAFASKHYSKKLATYSVGFDFDKGVNELPKAKRLAEKYGTEHHELQIGGYEVADIVEKMIEHHDQPFCDAANIPLYLLSQQVKNKTKVVLQGDGGDELYGGYKRYNTLANYKRMRFFANVGKVLNAFTARNNSYYTRQRYTNALLKNDPAEVMAALLTVEDCTLKTTTNIFSQALRQRVLLADPFKRYKELQSKYTDYPLADQMSMIDNQIILPDIFLEKVDKSTMASSIEVRVPFLDNDLVEFASSIPAAVKIPNGHQKYLLKKSLDGIVPDDVLYGKKTGFGVPFGFWVSNALTELLFDQVAAANHKAKVFDNSYIKLIHKQTREGIKDDGFMLWKVLNLAIWINKNDLRFDCE